MRGAVVHSSSLYFVLLLYRYQVTLPGVYEVKCETQVTHDPRTLNKRNLPWKPISVDDIFVIICIIIPKVIDTRHDLINIMRCVLLRKIPALNVKCAMQVT